LYEPPAACTPSISLTLGSRRMVSSLTTLPAIEDPQHALIARATALSAQEQHDLVLNFRAKEEATRSAISDSVRSSTIELVRMRRKHDTLTKSVPDLHVVATALSKDHDRHYQRVKENAAPAQGIFGRPRRSPVRLPRTLGDGFGRGGIRVNDSSDSKSVLSIDGSNVEDEEDDEQNFVGGSDAGGSFGFELESEACFTGCDDGSSIAAPFTRLLLHPEDSTQGVENNFDSVSQIALSTVADPVVAAATGGAAVSVVAEAHASALTAREVDSVLRQAIEEGCDHLVADDGTLLPMPNLQFVEPPPVLTLPSASPEISSYASPRKRLGASSTLVSTHSPHSQPSYLPSQAPIAPEEDLDPLAKELGMSPEQVARVQFSALRAMHRRMMKARDRGGKTSNNTAVQRAQREAIRNMAALHIGKGSEQLLATLMETGSDDEKADDFKWIRQYEGKAVQDAVQQREMRKRGIQAEAARKTGKKQDDSFVATEDVSAFDSVAGTLLASSNMATDGIGMQERNHTERRLAIISHRRRYETGSTFGHSNGLYSGVPYHRQVSITSGKVMQTGKNLGLSHVDLTFIRQATEKRRLREMILREHAKTGNASLQKVAAMRKQHGVPGSSAADAVTDSSSSMLDVGGAPTERKLQGVTVKEVHGHIDSLRSIASAFEVAAGDFSVVKVGLGSKLLAKQLYDDDV
jgi:hypothetical protein